MTKEFITENHIAYDELERLLNREKSLHHLSSESYKRLYEALIQQKANSSGRLIYRLTNFDGNFSIRFQRWFPECNTDELLLASMIHHPVEDDRHDHHFPRKPRSPAKEKKPTGA